jgi:predicted AlkP superfamily pyrophosphatase or phosphodiesterase
MKTKKVALVVAAMIGALLAENSKAAPAADEGRIVVMISLDGLAGYYIDDPQAEMTTLNELAAAGARSSGMRVVAPSVTWPNHTTLVTGDWPARHGVVGNNYYDRATGKRVVLISDPTYDKDQIVKVPTIYDLAFQNGLKTAALQWPASRNAKTLMWTWPDMKAGALRDTYTTPALKAECIKAGLWIDGSVDDPLEAEKKPFPDENTTKIFNMILHEHRPNLALLHLARVDHDEHQYGPKSPEAYIAVKAADEEVRQVWEELKRDFPGKATLIVVSDHGFSLTHRMVLPNVILRRAGLLDVRGIRVVKGEVDVVPQGGAAMIYILDEAKHDEIIATIRKAFAGVEGVEKVVGVNEFPKYGIANPKDDPHAPDLMLFASEGYAFGDTAAGALTFNEKPEKKGTHGHDPDLPDLHATFVAWGDGIKPGVKLGEIQNTTVAPTVAKLLGIAMPNVDGKPLDEILAPAQP